MPQQETNAYTNEQLVIYRLYVKYGIEQIGPVGRYVIRNLGFPFDIDNGNPNHETQVSIDFRKFLRQGNLTDNPSNDVQAFVTHISKDFLKRTPRSLHYLDQIYEDMGSMYREENQGRHLKVANRNRLYKDTYSIPYPYTTTVLRTMLRDLYYKVLHGTYTTTDLVALKSILPHEYLGSSLDRYLARWCAYVYNFEKNVIGGLAKSSWLQESLSMAVDDFVMESCNEREIVYSLIVTDKTIDLTDKEIQERMETLKELYYVVQLPRTDVIRVFRVVP